MISTLELIELIYYITESSPQSCIEALLATPTDEGHSIQDFLDELGNITRSKKHD